MTPTPSLTQLGTGRYSMPDQSLLDSEIKGLLFSAEQGDFYQWPVDVQRLGKDLEGGLFKKPRLMVTLNEMETAALNEFHNKFSALVKRLARQQKVDVDFKSMYWQGKHGSVMDLRFAGKHGEVWLCEETTGERKRVPLEEAVKETWLAVSFTLYPWVRSVEKKRAQVGVSFQVSQITIA